MTIPEEYVIQKFYQFAGYPKYVKSTNTYMGGCPICREGKSWGRKSRLYYIPKDGKICCHNCGWYGSPVNWVMEVEQISYKEVLQQIEECDYEYGIPDDTPKYHPPSTDLPRDSINLFDKSQVTYYMSDRMVKTAITSVVNRKLNTATNRPKALYISLTDNTHKNRLTIPFYDHKNECIFYQSRQLISDGTPKYLSKINSEKSLFNYNNVSASTDHVFITEGPIDSFFIKNSVAVAGIQEKSKQSLTTLQSQQLERLFLMQPVWVLDSQWQDDTSRIKTEILLKNKQCVFMWPKDIGQRFKDINEMCVYFDIDCITEQFILDNTFCGLKGIVKLKQIK